MTHNVLCHDVKRRRYVLFHFILLASPKKTNKQTNRKNFGRDTATAVANGQLKRARARIQMYNSYVSLAVIFPLIEAWITTSNSCLSGKKIKITKNIEKRWTKR